MRNWLGPRIAILAAIIATVAAVVTPACAPKPAVVPLPTGTRYPEFLQPTVPADLATNPAAAIQERAWRFLQAGDLRNAEREVATAIKLAPQFYPAETTAAYLDLARRESRDAVVRFDRALSRRADYAPALVGKGQALAALNRDDEAIDAFEAALRSDASLTEVQRRLDVTRLRVVQRNVAAARQSAKVGKFDEAMQIYRGAIERSPESAFLHRELAIIERDHGSGDAAIDHYRQASTLDPFDSASMVDLAEMLDARNAFDAALKAYGDALAVAPDPAVSARRDALRLRADVARLPAEYRAIEAAAQLTRGELAALIGFRLAAQVELGRPRDVGVITDIRGHWAERWILAVARAGVVDLYENHTFQPRAIVRRVDLAQAMTRVLTKIAVTLPVEARRWQNARGNFPDLAASHLAYPAASVVTAAGVMTTEGGGAFQPARAVTGAEATEAVQRVLTIAAGSVAGSAGGRP